MKKRKLPKQSSIKKLDLKSEVNKLGKNKKPQLRYIYLGKKFVPEYSRWVVLVYSPYFKEKKWYRIGHLRNGINPFRNNLDHQSIKNQVNSFGKNQPKDTRFKFVSVLKKNEGKRRRAFVRIKCLYTGEEREIVLRNLLDPRSKSNPFIRDNHEKQVVQPKFKSFLEKLGGRVDCEVIISKKSRVDFVYTNSKGRKIIIEVKSDIKRHSKGCLETQISRYKQEGKKKYGNKYLGTFLVSEKGTYGYSMKELKTLLINRDLL